MFIINNLSKKDIEYINQCNNKELTNFISEEKSKSMTLHRKANIGYALLKCNLIVIVIVVSVDKWKSDFSINFYTIYCINFLFWEM